MNKKILFSATLLLTVITMVSKSQTNLFPADGSAGLGTLTPASWFSDKVLQIESTRPTLRLAPLADVDIGTILFKGRFSEGTNGSADEFHFNYSSNSSNPLLVLGSYKNGAKTIISFLGSGNVGMGTDTPTEKLSVNGKIRAHEVKVETANWPDYVFEQDYKILGLDELDAYIKVNKHLPDMPSAREAESNGIALGEMNKLLLKKVEELTLHLIEKDKALRAESAMNIVNQKKLRRQKRTWPN